MSQHRPPHDHDAWEDEGDSPAFERVRKQTGKPQRLKGERRQQDKEWGRAHAKLFKQRARETNKP